MSSSKMWDHSITLYWVIMCCGWIRGEAIGYLAPAWGKNIPFEEALTDKFFQVPSKAFTVGGFVSLIVIVRTVIFCSGECRVLFDWLWAPYPCLILDNTKNFIDGEP